MRHLWLFCLFVNAALSQTNRAAPNHEGATSTSVAPDAAVLTIKGLCSAPPSDGKDSGKSPCETVVTRAQFEKLVNAIQPDADSASRRQIAQAYPQFLIMAHEAQQRGLDHQPGFEERLAFARLQILSQVLTRQIQQEAALVPDKDIDNWYQSHTKDFEQANLERLIVPNTRQQGDNVEEAMSREATMLRTRAAAGEDFTKLQKEAYEFAGVAGNNQPDPNMLDMHRRGLPPAHAAAFDLKPGEVSQVISDATGHYVYKMDSKEIQPLQDVRQEISNTLRRQRLKEMMEAVQRAFTTEMNRAYFGTKTKEDPD